MADAVWNMVVQVQGEAEVEALTKKIEASEAAINRHTAALKAGMISQQGFEGAARAHAGTIINSKARIDELTSSYRGNAMGLLYLGQAVDDVQYGFRAIVNNIPQLVMGFGGGAGLAGAVGIAAVAVNQLVNHWGDLISAFDGGATKRQAEEMAALAEATKTAAKEYERLAAARVGPGGTAVGATGEAIAGIGAEGLAEGIVAAFEREAGPFRPTREVTVGDQGETRQVELAQGSPEYAEAENKRLDEFRKAAQALVGDIAKNPDARQRVMEMAKANPADFPENAAFNLEESSPARMAEKQIAERKAKEWEGERKATEASKQAKEAEAKKTSDDIKERAAAKAAGIKKDEKAARELDDWVGKTIYAQKEDEIHGLEMKERQMSRDRAEKKSNKAQIFEGGRAFVEHNMTEGFNKVPNEQLKEARELNKKIDGLREDLRKHKQGFRLS